jgi:hypothetical protein
MKQIPENVLEKLRHVSCRTILRDLNIYYKPDITFKPKNNSSTSRVFVNSTKFEGELILTGPRFFCPILDKGGYGAIDLVMFLEGTTFLEAVKIISKVIDVRL